MNPSFDKSYYDRFYKDPSTRVASDEETARLVRFVCAWLTYLDVPIKRILDMGCGLGLWQPELNKAFPKASYTGVEVSEYVAKRHGWIHAGVNEYSPRGQFDLVICQDVFQYLSDEDALDGIERFGRWCRGVLYFAALTSEDWDHNVDRSRTDGEAYLRTADWYRDALGDRFIAVGNSLFVHRDADVVLFELEKATS